jgi:hypothetical protein
MHIPYAFNIQNSEKLIHNLKKTNIQTNTNMFFPHHIIDYYRYVDDILIIYNEDHTHLEDTPTLYIYIYKTPQT